MSILSLLPVQASEQAVRTDHIYFVLLALSFVVIALVLTCVIVFAARYRRGSKAKRGPMPKLLNREFEIGWTSATLFFALFIFWLLLIARVVVEFIRSVSRDWRPRGATVVILEVIMSLTDPPVKLLRRLIPQLTIGAVRFDLSIMVLLLVAFIGMQVALNVRG